MHLNVLRRVRGFTGSGKAIAVLAGAGALGLGVGAPKAAAPAPAAAASRCVPSVLNRSDILPGTPLAVSPLPESLDANPRTQISLLGVPASQISSVKVSGSATHTHTGTLRAYSQGDGESFLPAHPFQAGETVTVSLTLSGHAVSYHFSVSDPDPIPIPAAVKIASNPAEVQHFHSRPELQPPTIAVTTAAGASSAPGYIMATPYAGASQIGPMIFDDSGQVVWFDPLPYGNEATNLQVQQLGGKPVLTWWQGYIPAQGFGMGVEMIANSAYHQIARVCRQRLLGRPARLPSQPQRHRAADRLQPGPLRPVLDRRAHAEAPSPTPSSRKRISPRGSCGASGTRSTTSRWATPTPWAPAPPWNGRTTTSTSTRSIRCPKATC